MSRKDCCVTELGRWRLGVAASACEGSGESPGASENARWRSQSAIVFGPLATRLVSREIGEGCPIQSRVFSLAAFIIRLKRPAVAIYNGMARAEKN
jgi:hypothetical protein